MALTAAQRRRAAQLRARRKRMAVKLRTGARTQPGSKAPVRKKPASKKKTARTAAQRRQSSAVRAIGGNRKGTYSATRQIETRGPRKGKKKTIKTKSRR